MTAATGFSILGTIAPVSGRHQRGQQFGSIGRPGPAGRSATPDQIRTVMPSLGPAIDRLNADRKAWFDRTEADLRLKAGGAALAGLVLGWSMGGLPVALALMAGGAVFVALLLTGQSQGTTRETAKHRIMSELAPVLVGLDSIPPDLRAAHFPNDRVEGWGLFRHIHTITVDECLTGARDGHSVTLARIGLHFGNHANRDTETGGGLCFIVAEVALRASGKDPQDDPTLVVPEDAALALRAAPLIRRPPRVTTPDAGFDARYRVHGDAGGLGPEARAAFADLESVTRSDRTATQEVPAGTGLRPFVIISPDRLTVLTPLALFDGAFNPPPFWEAIDPDTLIPAFASDLFILNDHLTAALTLTKGLSR